ncbi:MAG: hypothetical protein WC486_00220 [Candidatus Omnitrophota bacterium]
MEPKLTPAQRMLLWSLTRKYKIFSSQGRLDSQGYFFYADERLAEELSVWPSTIMRGRRVLKKMGRIDFIPGKYHGTATRYQILKDSKLLPFQEDESIVNNPRETSKLLGKGYQNATPTKYLTKDIKKSITKNTIKTADDLFIASCKTRNEKLAALLEDLGIRAPDIFIKRWCEGLKARGGRCYDPDVCLRDFKEMCDRIKPHCKEVENIGPYVERSIKNHLEGNGPRQ